LQVSEKENNHQHHQEIGEKFDALERKLLGLTKMLVHGKLEKSGGCGSSAETQQPSDIVDHAQSYVSSASWFLSETRTPKPSKSNFLERCQLKLMRTFAASLFPAPHIPSPFSEWKGSERSYGAETATSMRIQDVFNMELSVQSRGDASAAIPVEEFDLQLELTLQYLKNDQFKCDQGDWEFAEVCFRKALEKLTSDDVKSKLGLEVEDINLMIGAICFEREKMEEVKRLLKPLADWKKTSSIGRAFMAGHILAKMYLRENDLRRAEVYALAAARGRRNTLGNKSALYLDSAGLVM
jgi:hypothetical protein